jgi:1-aminocyclopropane-1-carboxylate deaminase
VDFTLESLLGNKDIVLSNAILEPLQFSDFGNQSVQIQRDDLIHPIVSGNKWRKLEGWIRYAKENNIHTLVTFGGAYSNHLVATAAAGNFLGFQTIGILRADEAIDNHYLQIAKDYGMQIRGVSRDQYREKTALMSEYNQLEGCLLIPEGGQGDFALEGFESLVLSWKDKVDLVYHASATATTAVGLAKAIKKFNLLIQVKAVLVLKNLNAQIEYAQQHGVNDIIEFIPDFHFGGYAKSTPELIQFQKDFTQQTNIVIDPVYTAKALCALKDDCENGNLLPSQKVAFLHTGGMLGGLSEKFKNLL